MVFSSYIFVFYFLPLALLGYYTIPHRWRHAFLTIVSYIFYGWWNPWFVWLMLGSTAIDYGCGKVISQPQASQQAKKWALGASIASNLGLLAFFKYFGFAVSAASEVMMKLGGVSVSGPLWIEEIVLPVGICFYVFQSMSYCLDLWRGQARPARSFVDFACYVSFFPQLVAGPIVRYHDVAEQLRHREHVLEGFVYGLSRFALGFAKKVILANPCGPMADAAFGAGEGMLTVATAWIGLVAYALQIYFDFSAYSDMAIGLGRMFGFHFPENFNSPYKATSMSDFWRRWHISLSTFLRDNLYIPLGGNRKGWRRTYLNLLTVMVIGGLWHGAQWTFILWGLWHGLLLIGERLLPSFGLRRLRQFVTFFLILLSWVPFRAENTEVMSRYWKALFGFSPGAETSSLLLAEMTAPWPLFILCSGLIIALKAPNSQKWLGVLTSGKIAFSLLLLGFSLILLSSQGFNPFLYFQF